MIKVALLAIAISLLTIPTMAVPENITLGPYQISFDAGKEPQEWNITEEESETYDGVPYVSYGARSESVEVKATRYSTQYDQTNLNLKLRMERLEELAKSQELFCETYARTIDGHDGFVAHMMNSNGEVYFAQWWLTNQTLVGFDSAYPWNEGTLQLLKTIHVEKVA